MRHHGYGRYALAGLLLLALAEAQDRVGCESDGCGSQVCADVDYRTPADQMLLGKTLRVSTTAWSPFSIRDDTAPRGWRGVDFDVLDRISELLGFNYTVAEFSNDVDPSWMGELIRESARSDLVVTYWARTAARLRQFNMIEGHIDMSTVVAARLDIASDPTFRERAFSFFRPLSVPLWLLIVAMVILSGVVDYTLERGTGPGVRLSSSIYEYVAGTLWGGFEAPRSAASAVYQVVVAFIIMITVSACAWSTLRPSAAPPSLTCPHGSVHNVCVCLCLI